MVSTSCLIPYVAFASPRIVNSPFLRALVGSLAQSILSQQTLLVVIILYVLFVYQPENNEDARIISCTERRILERDDVELSTVDGIN